MSASNLSLDQVGELAEAAYAEPFDAVAAAMVAVALENPMD